MSVSETPIEDAYMALRGKLARTDKLPSEPSDFRAADIAIDAMTNTQLLKALMQAENL